LRRVLVSCLLLGIAAGCGAKKDPIESLLADLEEAAEARDAGRIEGHLTPDFVGTGGTRRGDVGPLLRRTFAAYESVNLDVYDVKIERQGESARLGFAVDFNGRTLELRGLAGLLPPSAMFRFDLGLRLAGDDWEVASADWEEVLPQDAP